MPIIIIIVRMVIAHQQSGGYYTIQVQAKSAICRKRQICSKTGFNHVQVSICCLLLVYYTVRHELIITLLML